ncbi:DUF3866 family protein [Clostridium formicaceticum]|uniref:DUF3866 domain-containing protein n=1 Tax=Clostridium formicaceticum TaxID=1497 RepID=A0AAC9RMB9_9CLOT|nr:DUF3866 family protein [Clostridium formicaceticum]AOY77084.1 hypothetical protein BJL90_15250 [Clostridium formicaceticum]ARE87593.1 hypothetical protein CLFO_19930 [Clostridium formicaceticum]
MLHIKRGKVIEILSRSKEKTKILVAVDEKEERALNYNLITGEVAVDDEVLLNTTAVELKLGTGGYHFVLYNLHSMSPSLEEDQGHIMKLRYTPLQLKVFATEEQNHPNHHKFLEFQSLKELPVIVGSLHSMLTPIAATLKYMNPNIKITYIMTDAAALPIYFSDTVYQLKEKSIVDSTITVGHAFGGDLEAVNIYNGLIAAKEITACDIAIVTMGPGIVGTGTPYGFTGIEQGQILDAVKDLGGIPIGVPRISFSDPRERHYGISHHSLTVFSKIAKTKVRMILPILPDKEKKFLYEQLEYLNIHRKHTIIEEDGSILSEALNQFNLSVKTMGRSLKDDTVFFLACSAAAVYGCGLLKNYYRK